MHKIDTDTAVGNEFVDGNAETSVRATRLNASWFNTIQRELCNVVQDAGIALSQSNDDQLLAALYIVAVKALTERNISGTITISAKGGYGNFGPGSVVFKAADGSAKEFSYNDCLRVKKSDGSVSLSLDEKEGLVFDNGRCYLKPSAISAAPRDANPTLSYRCELIPGGLVVSKKYAAGGDAEEVLRIDGDGITIGGDTIQSKGSHNLSINSLVSVEGFATSGAASFYSESFFKDHVKIDVPAGGANGHKKIFHSFQGNDGNILPISSDYTSSGYPLNREMYNEGDVVFIENTSASGAMQVSCIGANNQNYKVKCNAGQALMFVCRGRTGNKHKFTLVSGTCENVA